MDHCAIDGNVFRMSARLRERVLFAHHNLVTDGVFCEVQAILCRNVLIYFDEALQARVLRLFHASLGRGGILCLGNRESLRGGVGAPRFTPVNNTLKIFRRAEDAAA